MQIAKNSVATINYELKDDAGSVLDSSSSGEPLAYVHGTGQLIPGLESHLEGRTSGDDLKVTISPADGYGERDESLLFQVGRTDFPDDATITVGMQVEVQTPEGAHLVRVVELEGDNVTLDANHPLAGQTLHFAVSIVDVREATAEELEHGHVHGPGGHEH